MKVNARFQWALAVLTLLWGVACASSTSPPPPFESAGRSASYTIGVPDVLRVTVWKQPDLSVDAIVRRDGMISVPLINDVRAAGLTPEELNEIISMKLSGFISEPDVTVLVVSPDSQFVTVVGGVRKSGPVPLLRDMGVVEAVAAAGGFNAWANKDDVRVMRSIDGTRHSYRFSYGEYLKGKPNSDIALKPGDVVVIPE